MGTRIIRLRAVESFRDLNDLELGMCILSVREAGVEVHLRFDGPMTGDSFNL